MSSYQDMQIVLENQFHIPSEALSMKDNIWWKAEIVHCQVLSEATGQGLKSSMYRWSYDTILGTGIWQLIFHEIY